MPVIMIMPNQRKTDLIFEVWVPSTKRHISYHSLREIAEKKASILRKKKIKASVRVRRDL